MTHNLILASVSDGLARITLNRPEKANAINSEMLDLLKDVLRDLRGSDDIRALLLSGSGDRAFCAGADLGELGGKTTDSETAKAFDRTWDDLAGQISNFPALTIACWNGTCAGGGLSLSLGCDLRIASAHAETFYPVLRNGVLPSAGDVERFHDLIGPSHTKMLLLGGHRLTASEALDWGLVDLVVPSEELEDAAMKLSAAALATKTGHVSAFKTVLNHPVVNQETRELCYRAVYDQEDDAMARLRETSS